MKSVLKTKSRFLAAAFVLFALVSSSAQAGSEGHGGGGVIRNGRYLTFGSAGVQIGLKPIAKVPGLPLVISVFQGMPLDDVWKGRLLSSVFPMGARQYFALDSADLSAERRAALIQSYSDAIGAQVPVASLVIFAITSGTETFLLPEFFELNETQQAAILFHEGLWEISTDLTYRFVVDAEIAFENYVTQQKPNYAYDEALFLKLGALFKNNMIPALAAAKDDFGNGRLASLLNAGGALPIETIFGDHLFADDSLTFNSRSRWNAHLVQMILAHPDVQLFRILYALRDQISFLVVGDPNSYYSEWECRRFAAAGLATRANAGSIKPWSQVNSSSQTGTSSVAITLLQAETFACYQNYQNQWKASGNVGLSIK